MADLVRRFVEYHVIIVDAIGKLDYALPTPKPFLSVPNRIAEARTITGLAK